MVVVLCIKLLQINRSAVLRNFYAARCIRRSHTSDFVRAGGWLLSTAYNHLYAGIALFWHMALLRKVFTVYMCSTFCCPIVVATVAVAHSKSYAYILICSYNSHIARRSLDCVMAAWLCWRVVAMMKRMLMTLLDFISFWLTWAFHSQAVVSVFVEGQIIITGWSIYWPFRLTLVACVNDVP